MKKLLLLLLSVMVALVVGVYTTSSAHVFGAHSVRPTSGGGDLVIDQRSRYTGSIDIAINNWQRRDCRWAGCPGVHVFKKSAQYPATVVMKDYYKRNTGIGGYYSNPDGQPGNDSIFINVAEMDKTGPNSWYRRALPTHEIGHSLNLAHPPQSYCDRSIMTASFCGNQNIKEHDDADYYRYWVQ